MEDLKDLTSQICPSKCSNTYVDENEDYDPEHDSLSSDSFSKDSLLNGHHIKVGSVINTNNIRRHSFTNEESPKMNNNIRTSHLPQQEYAQTNNLNQSSVVQRSYNKLNAQKCDMTQSMYERPWVTLTNANSLSSANAKLREEKLRMAKEDQQRKHNQRIMGLNESEKLAENARRRKEFKSQKKIVEKKRKDLDRQRIVEERKEKLYKAEEARRKTILRKLVNTSTKRSSPQSSNNMMTMSCYGGFVSARSKPGNKEIVYNRSTDIRPVSSTGKVIGFGSSSPRPICENTIKLTNENKKIPEAILIKCELLSRPLSSRIPDRMTTSVYGSQLSNTLPRKPKRQDSFSDNDKPKNLCKQSLMMASVISFSSNTKSKNHGSNKPVVKADILVKEAVVSKKDKVHSKQNRTQELRPSSALSNSSKKTEESCNSKKNVHSKSIALPKNKKAKVDQNLDSDNIEEEMLDVPKPDHFLIFDEQETNASEISIKTNQSIEIGIGRALSTKDMSESEYKTRLMENRRLVREKREREREMLMKSEREKRHAEEMPIRESNEIERENDTYTEEIHFSTSNDDTLDGPTESNIGYMNKIYDEESQLFEIPEASSAPSIVEPQYLNNDDAEKNERKKRLNSIMSRVRKTNEESSSDGGISPRRTMSPEQAELEPDINSNNSLPSFRSSLLQSMVNNGRLTPTSNTNKDSSDLALKLELNSSSAVTASLLTLTSVRESIEDTESQITTRTSPSSVAIRSSGIEGNSLSDANSEFAPEIEFDQKQNIEEENQEKDFTLTFAISDVQREDCDGKEDSISLDDNIKCIDNKDTNGKRPLDNDAQHSSSSTENEEVNKSSFIIAEDSEMLMEDSV